jgi:hypothetical protein
MIYIRYAEDILMTYIGLREKKWGWLSGKRAAINMIKTVNTAAGKDLMSKHKGMSRKHRRKHLEKKD